jgi:hypothetical protein
VLVLLTAYTSIDGRQSTPVLFDERLVAATNAGGSMPIRHHGSLPGDTIVWPDLKTCETDLKDLHEHAVWIAEGRGARSFGRLDSRTTRGEASDNGIVVERLG